MRYAWLKRSLQTNRLTNLDQILVRGIVLFDGYEFYKIIHVTKTRVTLRKMFVEARLMAKHDYALFGCRQSWTRTVKGMFYDHIMAYINPLPAYHKTHDLLTDKWYIVSRTDVLKIVQDGRKPDHGSR